MILILNGLFSLRRKCLDSYSQEPKGGRLCMTPDETRMGNFVTWKGLIGYSIPLISLVIGIPWALLDYHHSQPHPGVAIKSEVVDYSQGVAMQAEIKRISNLLDKIAEKSDDDTIRWSNEIYDINIKLMQLGLFKKKTPFDDH
jgi:hypothetical protein